MTRGNRDGFIALTSALVIAALLLAASVAASRSGAFARFNALDSEEKSISEAAAESCVEKALLAIARNEAVWRASALRGEATVDAGAHPPIVCHIAGVSSSSGEYVIDAWAEFPPTGFPRAATNLRVTVKRSDLSIVSWQELACHSRAPPVSPC